MMIHAMKEDAAAVATWSLLEEKQLPWWRFSRRRYLQRIFEEKCAERDRMADALEADVRAV